MGYPSQSIIQAGLDGLSRVASPMVANTVFRGHQPIPIGELAMSPSVPASVLLQKDDASGDDGYLMFQFSDYFQRMLKWKRGTQRQPWLGGTGNSLRIDAFAVQATESLPTSSIPQFAEPNSTPLQQQEMAITVDRVVQAINAAKEEDPVDYLLEPMVANTWIAYDGEPLISKNHVNVDESVFSNLMVAGTPIEHYPALTPPTRSTLGAPTVDEMYNELYAILTYFRYIKTRKTRRFVSTERPWRLTVIVRDSGTLAALERLNDIEKAKFEGTSVAETQPNGFYRNLTIVHDTDTDPVAGAEYQYHVIPGTNEFSRETPQAPPNNPLGLNTWVPEPRPFIFTRIREARGLQTKYDEWDDPMNAMVGLWELWGMGAGFPSEIIRYEPDEVE